MFSVPRISRTRRHVNLVPFAYGAVRICKATGFTWDHTDDSWTNSNGDPTTEYDVGWVSYFTWLNQSHMLTREMAQGYLDAAGYVHYQEALQKDELWQQREGWQL